MTGAMNPDRGSNEPAINVYVHPEYFAYIPLGTLRSH
jgi:hypothetical protein